jgi:cytochrome P450
MEAFAFDPFDDATRRDPFPLYARARREHPLWRHPGFPAVSLFRYADIQAVLRDAATWSNRIPLPAEVGTPEDRPPSMLGTDPPEHTRLRGLVSQAFTPRMIRQMVPRMRAVAEELLTPALARREVDLVEALAYPLPVIVIAEMIGIPAADRARFKQWSDELVANLGLGLLTMPSPERLERQRRILEEMRGYFMPLVAERRAAPRDDLLTGLVRAELEGSRLGFDEMMEMLVLLLVAGNETTTALVGNAVVELCRHPDQLALLRARPELVTGAVDEVLRFASPVQLDPRRATRPVELCGERLDPDTVVLCWLGSANRDEAVFEDPERFDVTRRDSRHLAFGFGPHFCLGAHLAELEAETALRALLERTRAIHRVDDTPLPLHPSFVFRGVTRLPVVLQAA